MNFYYLSVITFWNENSLVGIHYSTARVVFAVSGRKLNLGTLKVTGKTMLVTTIKNNRLKHKTNLEKTGIQPDFHIKPFSTKWINVKITNFYQIFIVPYYKQVLIFNLFLVFCALLIRLYLKLNFFSTYFFIYLIW